MLFFLIIYQSFFSLDLFFHSLFFPCFSWSGFVAASGADGLWTDMNEPSAFCEGSFPENCRPAIGPSWSENPSYDPDNGDHYWPTPRAVNGRIAFVERIAADPHLSSPFFVLFLVLSAPFLVHFLLVSFPFFIWLLIFLVCFVFFLCFLFLCPFCSPRSKGASLSVESISFTQFEHSFNQSNHPPRLSLQHTQSVWFFRSTGHVSCLGASEERKAVRPIQINLCGIRQMGRSLDWLVMSGKDGKMSNRIRAWDVDRMME